MKRITLIIAGALAGIILFQYLFNSCESRKKDKQMAAIITQLQACENAPEKIDTFVVRTVLTDTIYLTYQYQVTDTVRVSDAVDWQARTIQQRTYTGTYVHPQFEAHWSALVTGTLDKMTINPPSLIRSLIITKEKTVDLTDYKCPPAKERSHLYASMGAAFTFQEVTGIDAGLQWIHRRGFGLRAGIGTDFERVTYNAGMIIKLK